MTKELRVLIDGEEIGTVIQDGRGRFQFTYDENYRKCASASAIDPATARSAPIRALLLTHDALH
jgi:HipA N-terminal domain